MEQRVDTPFRQSLAQHPDRCALALWGTEMSFREVDAAAGRLASRLGAPGERVGVLAPNVPALVIAMLACWKAGAIAVPINARSREYELRRLLLDAQTAVVIAVAAYRGYSFTSVLRAILPEIPSVRVCLMVDPFGDVEEVVPGPGTVTEIETLSADIAAILYTSGTTGEPKGALVLHRRESEGARVLAEILGLTPADVTVLAIPASHAFGLTCLLAAIAAGSCAVLVDSTFSMDPLFRAIDRYDATILHGSPALFASFLGAAATEARSIRTGFVAGAACPPRILAQMDDRDVRLLNLYGMTEIGAATCCRMNDPPGLRYETCGRPLPGFEFRVVPPHPGAAGRLDGQVTGAGEVQVRGPSVLPGYLDRPESDIETFDDGWFRTGDVGSFDAGGNLMISGRLKEIITVSGFTVFPAEVEGFLQTHPDVVEAAVVGIPHDTMGEVPAAFIVVGEGSSLTAPALLQFARAQIAGYKLPYTIQFVSELPRLPSGKLDRHLLRRLADRRPDSGAASSGADTPQEDAGARPARRAGSPL